MNSEKLKSGKSHGGTQWHQYVVVVVVVVVDVVVVVVVVFYVRFPNQFDVVYNNYALLMFHVPNTFCCCTHRRFNGYVLVVRWINVSKSLCCAWLGLMCYRL